MSQVKNIHILIEGRVQGVGFRKFSQVKARAHGLKGSVRNLMDGRVEIYVSGQIDKIDAYTMELHLGPPFAKVRSIKINTVEKTHIQDFEIINDEELK